LVGEVLVLMVAAAADRRRMAAQARLVKETMVELAEITPTWVLVVVVLAAWAVQLPVELRAVQEAVVSFL